ncbi:hypothetical protein BS78_03G198300 [Paspalum vaginatum]|nr:hypothetical protein BS78_03G198300 [Paspalum vaginatum]
MKNRRMIGVEEERAQCSDPRGAADWAALQQNPVELLRKLDELRDQITRSCYVAGQPRERRMAARRAVSMLPEHLEPPPPAYHRPRYGGRYGHGLPPPPPSPYAPLRPEHGERYARQPSGLYRQYPGRHWENGGMGPGSYHHYGCACPHCLHVQRAPPQEENIPMARYFAAQHESYRLERSPSVSSDYDRRSVASSLYSHRSVSKRRAEYFRKKAEHICRPVDGAAPFTVCSSCYKLLQMPMEKCIGRKLSRFQCGSCCQIVSLKRGEENGTPFAPSSSLYEPEMGQSSSDQNRRDSAHRLQEDFNSMLYHSNDHSSMQINMDFADDNSLSSTMSHEKGCGSNRSIQSKAGGLSFSPRRSVDVGSPKDILCERDADCEMEPSVDGPLSPRSPVLEDKLVDPLCTQEKGNGGDDQGMTYTSDLSCKGECDANDEYDESISTRSKQKSNEADKDATEDESSCRSYEQKSMEYNCCNLEDGCKTHEQNSAKDDTSGLVDASEKYECMNIKDDNSSHGGENTSNNYGPKTKGDEKCVLGAESASNVCDENDKEDVIEVGSTSERHEELKMEEDDGKSQQPFIEDANSLTESGSSVNERTNSGFSRGSSEAGLDEDQSSTGKSGDSSFFAGFLKKGFKDLSLLNKSMDSAKVSINGHPISERALKKAEKKAGPVDPGSYWYDYRAGFWGVMGRECIGIIPPFIREFNYPMARNCAGGDTGVFVNGRELCQRDLDLLVGRGLPRISGKSYSIEISGNITDEATGKKLRSLGKLAPTIEKLKRGFGMHVPEEFR